MAPPVVDVDSAGDLEVVDPAVQGELLHLRRLGSPRLQVHLLLVSVLQYFEV